MIAAQSEAAVVWSWEFTSPEISTGLNGVVHLEIQVFNHSTSDSPMEFGSFYLSDGSWGNNSATFSNAYDEIIFVANLRAGYGFNHPIDPGQSLTFIAAELVPFSLVGGESIYIDPVFYVGGSDGFLPGQLSSNGIQVNVASVPLPSAAGLFFCALIGLRHITSKGCGALCSRSFERYV